MSALMIARITVKDPAKFQDYLAKTQQVAAPYGAELLFRGKVDRALTGGASDHELAVIVSFPSLQAIRDWYGSEAYRPLIALRDEGSDMVMTSYALAA